MFSRLSTVYLVLLFPAISLTSHLLLHPASASSSTVSENYEYPPRKRSLVWAIDNCPPDYILFRSFCRYEVSPQTYATDCMSDLPNQHFSLDNDGECASTEIYVEIGTVGGLNLDNVNIPAGRRAYCVSYEYFLRLSRVYTHEGGDKAGMIFSQLNFNAGQRATFTGGGYGLAAVLTGLDDHSSLTADWLRIEALGVKRTNGGWGPQM